jgi:hypothetical protein
MPATDYVRERLIQIIHDSESGSVSQRDLIRAFDKSRQHQASEEIKKMLNENIFAVIGRGVRGDAVRVVFSGGYDGRRCKFCGQTVRW